MSAILAGSSACVCNIRRNIVASARPWCRTVSTTIARRPTTHSELERTCCRSLSSKASQNPGNDPSKRRIAGAVFAAVASGVCFDRFGTITDDNDGKKFGETRGPMVANMTKRRDTTFQIRLGDSLLVDHTEPQSSKTIAGANDDQIVLLQPEDKEIISPFLYYLMTHVKLVRVQEDDNQQYNLPIGLPGLGCVYCNCEGSRSQVFPLDRRTFPYRVRKHLYNHIRRCQRCPLEVKLELRRLKNLESGNGISREERLFFRELWFRMGHKAVI